MNIVSWIMACFSLLGAADRIIGNRFGLGKEYEKGINLLGAMSLSMIGMIVISPVIADLLNPFLNLFSVYLPFDPSILPACLFANDMGGASLAVSLAKNSEIGNFNALVVSSMMGATVSFTIPVALGMVEKSRHDDMLLGLLCGIVTIPIGCFAGGLVLKLPIKLLFINLLPLILFSLIIGFGLMKFPEKSVKIFAFVGNFIKILIIIGLAIGIFRFLTGVEIIKNTATYEDGAKIVFNAAAVMTGAFPLIYIISKLLNKPMKLLSRRIGINETSAVALIGTLATNITTFPMIKDMDKKGTVLNSAFAVSAAFTFAGHLAFTLAFNSDYLPSVIVGKLTAGIFSLVVANFIYGRTAKKNAASAE